MLRHVPVGCDIFHAAHPLDRLPVGRRRHRRRVHPRDRPPPRRRRRRPAHLTPAPPTPDGARVSQVELRGGALRLEVGGPSGPPTHVRPLRRRTTLAQPNASSRNDTKRHENRVRTSSGGTRRHASTQNDTNRHERPPTWSRTKTCAKRRKMQDVSTACSIEIEQNIGHQASHARDRWFDPSRAHSDSSRHADFAQPCESVAPVVSVLPLSCSPRCSPRISSARTTRSRAIPRRPLQRWSRS